MRNIDEGHYKTAYRSLHRHFNNLIESYRDLEWHFDVQKTNLEKAITRNQELTNQVRRMRKKIESLEVLNS